MIEPGTVVGNYVVEGVLGRGSVGVVVKARHQVLETEHAIKVLRVDDPESRRRLVDEGRAQAHLSHPNLVRVTDVVSHEGRPGLVMDLVEGPTLATLLRRARPMPEDARQLWFGIVAGVTAAHAAGLVHRDLEPANLLLDRTHRPPRPRVTDFGIARALGVPGATSPGRMLGTFGYLAPEQLADASSTDARADVFSLGVLGVELFTGGLPFPTTDITTWLAAVQAGWEPSADIPPDIGELFARCLNPDPGRRPADASALLDDLTEDLTEASGPSRRTPPPPSRRHPLLPWAAGTAALSVSALTLVSTSHSGPVVPVPCCAPTRSTSRRGDGPASSPGRPSRCCATRPPRTATPSPASSSRSSRRGEVPHGSSR